MHAVGTTRLHQGFSFILLLTALIARLTGYMPFKTAGKHNSHWLKEQQGDSKWLAKSNVGPSAEAKAEKHHDFTLDQEGNTRKGREFQHQGHTGILLDEFKARQQFAPTSSTSQPARTLLENEKVGTKSLLRHGNERGLAQDQQRRLQRDETQPDPTNIRLASNAESSNFYQVEKGSPMPKEDIVAARRAQGCLPTEDGNYGSQDGDQVNSFFFYHVEAAPGTTATQINGIILEDIEIALLDLMIPSFFAECGVASQTAKTDTGRYVGMSSKPADFVLRGFDCTEKAKEPCFVVSGSMTAYVNGIGRAAVKNQMELAIYLAFESGAIASSISRINGVTLLNEQLNPMTPPQTLIPTTRPPAIVTTDSPSPVPTTDLPTLFPSATPTTPAPTTLEPTTSSPTTANPTKKNTYAPTTEAPTLTIETGYPTGAQQVETSSAAPTQPEQSQTESPTIIGNQTGLNVPSSGPVAESNATPQPAESASQGFVITDKERQSAFEKVPVWAWVIMALTVCVCCSYTDPDDDEDETGVNQTLREQERRTLSTLDEHEKERDSMHDSEAFSSVEYVRKLYRQ